MDENSTSGEKPKLRLKSSGTEEPKLQRPTTRPEQASPPEKPKLQRPGETPKLQRPEEKPKLQRPAPKTEEPAAPEQEASRSILKKPAGDDKPASPPPPPPPRPETSAPVPPPPEVTAPEETLQPPPASTPEAGLEKATPSPEPKAGPGPEPDGIQEPAAGDPPPRGPWLSLFVIFALFLVLAASGLGIWWVLRTPAATPETAGEQVGPETAAAPAASGPVGKARQTVAAVEAKAVPDELLETPAPADRDAAPLAGTAATEAAVPSPAPAPTTDVAAHTEAVTRYLETIFIGAVGGVATNPRAMIDGKNYMKGDVVNDSLGLKFIEVDGGTLYFKDSNDVIYVKRF